MISLRRRIFCIGFPLDFLHLTAYNIFKSGINLVLRLKIKRHCFACITKYNNDIFTLILKMFVSYIVRLCYFLY